MQIIDPYTFRARLVPVFILLLPLGLGFLALFPGESLLATVLKVFGTLSAETVVALLLSEIGRDAGKHKESDLYRRWGGAPTDFILSHNKSPIESATVSRYRNKLTALLPEVSFPSAEDEVRDPQKALDVYRSCTRFLKERTRPQKDDDRFSLLFSENVSYGFRRNLWAMKPAGVVIAVLGLGASALAFRLPFTTTHAPIVAAISSFLSAVLLVWWLVRITPSWVRIPANAYAERLFASCEIL